MAIKRCVAGVNVVEAAKIRIRNVFKNGLPVYLSFSGGKDSIVLADLVLKLINSGEIDPAQLRVVFIDEEAIYDCVVDATMKWRQKFLLAGAQFFWYCIEVKHFSCFNELTEDESYTVWDHTKQDVWVREPPSFAIRDHPLLKPGIDNYQAFLPRICADGITITGVRAAESIQRLKNIAKMTMAGSHITGKNQILPIYDWRTSDVWLYLLNENLDIPEAYLWLWQVGVNKNQLRLSQFFSIDTAQSLVKLGEYQPELMSKILKREPNAYIATLYWDSEMFGRRSSKRNKLEQGEPEKDYKALLIHTFNNADTIFTAPISRYTAARYKNFFIQVSAFADNRDCRQIYEALMRGDPKLRAYRALYQNIYGRYIDKAKKDTAREGVNSVG